MAVSLIPNQPIAFYTEEFNLKNYRCTQDNTRFCQLVTRNQIQQFQVQTTPQSGSQLLVNNQFIYGTPGGNPDNWLGNGWTWLGGSVIVLNPVGGETLGQTVTVEADSVYKISYRVIKAQDEDYVIGVFATAGSSLGGDSVVQLEDHEGGQWITQTYYWLTGAALPAGRPAGAECLQVDLQGNRRDN